MIGLLMRRMMHYENWNTIGGSINHDHKKSGLCFLEDEKNSTFLKAMTCFPPACYLSCVS